MTELWRLDAAALAQRFDAGTTSPTEALEATLSRIAAVDGAIGAFRCVLEESARAEARARSDELARGHRRGPLHGVPVAVKELFDVVGAPGDYGSDVLAGRTAERDAALVTHLRRSGAVIVGTTCSHEFGWGITTQHHRRGGARNPWNLARVPGGSSGGSGAAVASGMVPVAVGSDTGGSVRIPASFCGVAGLKPSFGLVGRTGGVALAPSFDTPGALARTITDAATLVGAMCGEDASDPGWAGRTWCAQPVRVDDLTGFRVATAANLIDVDLDAAVGRCHDTAIESLAGLGAEIVEVDLPSAGEMLEAFVPLQMAEAHDVHHRVLGLYPGQADLYGPDVRSRLEAASEVDIGHYLTAREARDRIRAAFDRCLRDVDAIISPITAVAPSSIDDPDIGHLNGGAHPLRDLVMRFTIPQNLTGLPSAIVRAGFDGAGMPVGVQLTAARHREDTAVTVAAALQTALGAITTAPDPNPTHGR